MKRSTSAAIILTIGAALRAAAAGFPTGEVIPDVPVRSGSFHIALYLPTTYDPSVPTPILYVQDWDPVRRLEDLTPVAKRLGWLLAAIAEPRAGTDRPPDTAEILIRESERLLNVHPTLRFATPSIADRAEHLQKLQPIVGLISGWYPWMLVELERSKRYPPSRVMFWIPGRPEPRPRADCVDAYLWLLSAQNRTVRLFVEDETHTAGPVEIARWMMRQYLRQDGKLLSSDRARVESFLAAELKDTSELKESGKLYEAFLIANDLFQREGPSKAQFGGLRAELLNTPEVQVELAAASALERILRRISPPPAHGSSILEPTIAQLTQLIEKHPNTEAARTAALFKQELAARM